MKLFRKSILSTESMHKIRDILMMYRLRRYDVFRFAQNDVARFTLNDAMFAPKH